MVAPLVLWALPASWLVHDLEEVLTIDAWSRRWMGHTAWLEARSLRQRRLVEALASTSGEFTVAAALVGSVVFGATVAGTLDPDGVGMLVYATILGGYGLHGVLHIAQSALLRGYVPGLVTAVLLVIPVSGVLYWRLLASAVLTPTTALATGLLGLALFVPIVVGANALSTRLARRR